MMTSNLESAKRFLRDMRGENWPVPVLAAVSGGLDSMCLLHLLSTWGKEEGLAVAAAHFNHGLRGEMADRDEAFVKEMCSAWGIPCVCGRGDTRGFAEQKGLSLEEAARILRYEFLSETQQQGGQKFVLTAHHADDNAETMLLNLIRGTGLRGLTGIPEFRGCIARPFLQITREELAAYAETHSVPHVEDETNRLDDATRNVLRHKVFPVLKELNPRAVENMTRTANLLAQDEKALMLETNCLLRAIHWHEKPTGSCAEISLEACKEYPKAVLSRGIWSMMTRVCGRQRDLTAAHVEAVTELIHGTPWREVSLPYDMMARCTEETLVILRQAEQPKEVPLHKEKPVSFGNWTITLTKTPRSGMAVVIPKDSTLSVTTWRRDDRMTLPGAKGSRSLKRLCAERGIHPWQRDRLPVLRVENRVAAVPGIGVDMDFMPRTEDTAGYVIFHERIEEREHEK